jgi:hypothetical protein
LANFPDQPISFPYSALQFERDRKNIALLIDQIDADIEFPLTGDEKKCGYCSYRSYCDRGVSAGISNEENEMRSEMPELSLADIQEIEF